MITPAYTRTMAAYNRWQNRSLYAAADALSDAQRKEPRGAFFGSIHDTLNHLLWADQIWLSRFAGTPRPKAKGIQESVTQYDSWAELKATRAPFDEDDHRLGANGSTRRGSTGDLTWFSGAVNREVTKPRALLIAHFFNHQTHHRGQVHCMLTQCGAKPEATDLPVLPAG